MKTGERKNGEANSETLKEIKQQFSKIVKSLEDGQKVSHSTSTKFNQVKHQKYSVLEKQHKIMLYELRLLTGLLERLGIDQKNKLFIAHKEQMDRQIKMGQVNSSLEIKIEKIDREAQLLRNENRDLKTKNESLLKNMKICENRVSELEKHGGITKIIQLKDSLRQSNTKNQLLQNEREKQKQQIKKLKQKCIILQELNKETEEKLALALLEILELKGDKRVKTGKQNIDQNKGGLIKDKDHMKQKNYKIQLLAAKDEIKCLKNKIMELEQEKETLKIKHQNRENIFEKMLVKKLRN